jgi:hypothetical protein
MTNKLNIPLKTLVATSLAIALAACSEKAEEPAETALAEAADEAAVEEVAAVADDNPFYKKWDTPYGIPPFDAIRDEHYKPAFEAGIEELRADVAAIRDNPEPPDFGNTIEALELAGQSLTKVNLVFSNITNTDTNDALQELEVEISPVLTREQDAFYLDNRIFERVNAVYDARESLGLDDQAMRLVELWHRDFVRRGAALDAEAKARMKDINARISELNTVFAQNLLKETKAFELVITDETDLSGQGRVQGPAGRVDFWSGPRDLRRLHDFCRQPGTQGADVCGLPGQGRAGRPQRQPGRADRGRQAARRTRADAGLSEPLCIPAGNPHGQDA